MVNDKKVDIENNLTLIRSLIAKHKRHDHIFAGVGMFVIISLTITLLVLFLDLVFDGYPRFNLDFLTNFPSRRATAAGILSAWVGSSLVLIVTFFAAVPLGIAAGVYLEEYAKKNWFSDLIEINVTNLAGVPSIIYGLLALGLFVYGFGLGQTILTAGLTLAQGKVRVLGDSLHGVGAAVACHHHTRDDRAVYERCLLQEPRRQNLAPHG